MLAKLQMFFRRMLRRELPLLLSWKRIAAAALVPAGILLFFLFFLEPNGTDRYRSSWRSIRLCGYALCVIVPSLAVHGFDLWIYRRQKGSWTLVNAICSRIFTLFGIINASYLYNAHVVNSVSVSSEEWSYFFLHFGLPYAVLLLPPLIYVEQRWAGVQPRDTEKGQFPGVDPNTLANTTICIQGKNNEEQLIVPASAFLYAEALQNYVSIVFLNADVPAQLEKRVFRATLAEIFGQIPMATRIHRSYVINPVHLLRVETNKRKRLAYLAHLDTPLPVSAERF